MKSVNTVFTTCESLLLMFMFMCILLILRALVNVRWPHSYIAVILESLTQLIIKDITKSDSSSFKDIPT